MPLTTPETGALMGRSAPMPLEFTAGNDHFINAGDDGVDEAKANAADDRPLQRPGPGGCSAVAHFLVR